ncbi:FMN-binding negative transcriptional regulator [Pontibacter sp. H249]|uniref:FMN-binding negative transcriptional regulator n=1 Tax=Pontibacter sp. H249 TaxID=3133420 RepID=UPI0030C43052
MYTPTHYQETDMQKLLGFIRAFNFATLVTIQDKLPVATHLPFVVNEQEGQLVLLTHMAKQNPQWQDLEAGQEALVIFQEPHAYISPSLYEKQLNVPTWNYCAVHAYGKARIIVEPEQMISAMETSIKAFDAEYLQQFRSLPEKYTFGMLKGIVMFEIAVSRLEGKYKISQNKSDADKQSVMESLLKSEDRTVRKVGEIMQEKYG